MSSGHNNFHNNYINPGQYPNRRMPMVPQIRPDMMNPYFSHSFYPPVHPPFHAFVPPQPSQPTQLNTIGLAFRDVISASSKSDEDEKKVPVKEVLESASPESKHEEPRPQSPIVSGQVVEARNSFVSLIASLEREKSITSGSNGTQPQSEPIAISIIQNKSIEKAVPPSEIPKVVERNEPVKPVVSKPRMEEELFLVGQIRDGRRAYTIEELFKLRQSPASRMAPEQLLISSGHESYARVRGIKDTRVQYKRSADAWVGSKERLRNLPEDQAKVEKVRIRVQSAVNKFTKNTFEVVLKDLNDLLLEDPKALDFMIDCVFRSVTRNGAWIMEFTNLCVRLEKELPSGDSKKRFNKKLIAQFTKGSEISDEWKTKHQDLRNRPITTIEELDVINEDLQVMERSQRTIVVGCAKFLAYLFISGVYLINDVLSFLTGFQNKSHELEIETLCSFLTVAGPQLKLNRDCKGVLNESAEYIKSRSLQCSMRVRFVIQDLLKLHSNDWKAEQTTKVRVATIERNSSQNQQRPQRTSRRNVESSWPPQQTNSSSRYKNDLPEVSSASMAFEMKNRNVPRYQPRARASAASSTRPPQNSVSREAPKKVEEFDYMAAQTSLVAILEDFTSTHDISKFISEFKNLEIASHMPICVNIALTYVIERLSVDFCTFGQLLLTLLQEDRLIKSELNMGLSKFLVNFNDLLVDLPTISNRMACCVLYLFVSGKMNFTEYYDLLVQARVSNPVKCISDAIDEFIKYTSVDNTIHLWQSETHCGGKGAYVSDVLSKHPNLSNKLENTGLVVIVDALESLTISTAYSFDSVSSMDEKEFNQFLESFAKLFHFCCPLSSLDISTYINKSVSDHSQLIRYITGDIDKLVKLYQYLKCALGMRRNMPSDFIHSFTLVLVQSELSDLATLEGVFDKIGDEDFSKQLIRVKNSINRC